MNNKYLEPSLDSIKSFLMRNNNGPIVMLNLLKFRKVADYSLTPNLEPKESISGKEAYKLYTDKTFSFVRKMEGEVLFYGNCDKFLIGPESELWDAVLIIKYKHVQDFIDMTANSEYIKGYGHRLAALEDSRLLPVVEGTFL